MNRAASIQDLLLKLLIIGSFLFSANLSFADVDPNKISEIIQTVSQSSRQLKTSELPNYISGRIQSWKLRYNRYMHFKYLMTRPANEILAKPQFDFVVEFDPNKKLVVRNFSLEDRINIMNRYIQKFESTNFDNEFADLIIRSIFAQDDQFAKRFKNRFLRLDTPILIFTITTMVLLDIQGNGVPANINEILQSHNHSSTVFWATMTVLGNGSMSAILTSPWVEALSSNDFDKLKSALLITSQLNIHVQDVLAEIANQLSRTDVIKRAKLKACRAALTNKNSNDKHIQDILKTFE